MLLAATAIPTENQTGTRTWTWTPSPTSSPAFQFFRLLGCSPSCEALFSVPCCCFAGGSCFAHFLSGSYRLAPHRDPFGFGIYDLRPVLYLHNLHNIVIYFYSSYICIFSAKMIFLPHELSKSHLLQLFIEYATIHQAIRVDFLLPCVVGFAAC